MEVKRGVDVQLVPAGGGVVITEGAPLREATADEKGEVMAWKAGTLKITNKPLKSALASIKRWYGYDIMVAKPEMLNRPVTLTASLDSAMQAVAGVEKSTGLLFGYYGANMGFSDSSDKKMRRK